MAPTKESQAKRILRKLKLQKTVTNFELNQICYRYSARIHELRDEGHLIDGPFRVSAGLNKYIYRGHVDDEPMEYED